MQNKANFKKVKFYATYEMIRIYEKKDTWWNRIKQSQTNPNKAKFKKAKMNVNKVLTKDYENKSPIRVPKKQSQISKRQKTMQTSLTKGIMKKTVLSSYDKTNPKQTQFQSQKMLLIFTPSEVLENYIMTSYHLEPTRPINHRRLP